MKFDHNYLLPGPNDGDILKVMGSKVKVTDNMFQKCTFPLDVCQSMDCCRSPLVFCDRLAQRCLGQVMHTCSVGYLL